MWPDESVTILKANGFMLRSCDENKKLTMCSKTIGETSATATLTRRIRGKRRRAAYSSGWSKH